MTRNSFTASRANPIRTLKGFQHAISSARGLAGARLREKPGDPEALFALTMAAGMESNSLVVLLKKHLDGLSG